MPRTMTLPAVTTASTDLAEHLPAMRAMLEEQRRFRLDQLSLLTAEDGRTRTELIGAHLDDLEAGAESARAEVSAVLTAAARQTLDDIEAALARIDNGTYGRCGRCRQHIPIERLQVVPQAGLCMNCQRHVEKRR